MHAPRCMHVGTDGQPGLQAHKEDGFRWWVQRLSRCFQLHDEVRIDHFRGFAGAVAPSHVPSSPLLMMVSCLILQDQMPIFFQPATAELSPGRQCGRQYISACWVRVLCGGRKGRDGHARHVEEGPRRGALCCAGAGASQKLQQESLPYSAVLDLGVMSSHAVRCTAPRWAHLVCPPARGIACFTLVMPQTSLIRRLPIP